MYDLVDSGFYHVEGILYEAGLSDVVAEVGLGFGISGGVSDLGRDGDTLLAEYGSDSVPDSGFVYDDVEGRIDFLESGD